jgi:hypothetical protein
VFEGKRLLSVEKLKETHTPQMIMMRDERARAFEPETHITSYGLGWVVQDYHGHLMVSHGGGIDGFRSQIALVPQAKLGVIILANRDGNAMPEALRNSLFDQLLNLPKRDWNALTTELTAKAEEEQKKKEAEREENRYKDTKPSRELAAYTGAYEEPAYSTAHVTLENDTLRLQWSSFNFSLEHFHFDTFTAKLDYPSMQEPVVFSLNAEGEVETLRVLNGEFKKAKKK